MIRERILVMMFLIGVIGPSVSCRSNINSTTAASDNGAGTAPNPVLDVVKVVSKKLAVNVRIPGELQPYEVVAIFRKVTGFVERIGVDRGSAVRAGEVIARLVAPEIAAQRAEGQSKLQAAMAQQTEVEAKVASDEGTYQKLKAASATPGVVAGNDLNIAQKTVEADRARAKASHESVEAARAAVRSISEIESYLIVRAPFDGVVTERNVHPGALVGPAGGAGAAVPIVRIENTSRLRLVVPVPEKYAAGVQAGATVAFTVPAYPGEEFTGTLSRISRSVDIKTRTMPVEVDVNNTSGRLASGMFPEVVWPVRRAEPTLFVPSSAVVKTSEKIFVIRVHNGVAEWVDVQTGENDGKAIEIFGNLSPLDEVVVRGSDEIRPGTPVTAKLISPGPQE